MNALQFDQPDNHGVYDLSRGGYLARNGHVYGTLMGSYVPPRPILSEAQRAAQRSIASMEEQRNLELIMQDSDGSSEIASLRSGRLYQLPVQEQPDKLQKAHRA